ncbi:zinc dependent phospholipase C family protein [Mucilaginibacter sp. BT774]|uniref:zinc dependent phospholipase C family protein n=1 Tax=Mucilaginibacter sp. BT774 TaxID=3062276 RepID=UPI0026752E08|nr:zinc dependent phospholipase C family protein [Mucilaginibacter sp. BT774]
MSAFYKANIDFITEHAVEPDKKRYVDSLEGSGHFFDADHYGRRPFMKIPVKWNKAAKKYSADTLNKYGTVPWEIQYQYNRLVDDFKNHDTTDILKTSSNLGHYIAVAHVPLQLTQNYNGQLTHQDGIHALWESRLPELFSDHYNDYVGKARNFENPLNEAFKLCRSSYNCVDSVLRFERMINQNFPADKKYDMVKHGNRNVQDYSEAYAKAYHIALKGMVRRRMRSAILEIGSFWYSAWVDAGQPVLNKLIDKPLSPEEKKRYCEVNLC